eukprot:Em0019g602a
MAALSLEQPDPPVSKGTRSIIRSEVKGGCFGASLYVAYERAKLPLHSRNRHWLTAICVVTAGLGVARLIT